MGKRFSIITPIYLGEDHEKERRLKLFPKCIESIKDQTFRDFEHIIVNDGSTIPLEVPNYSWIRIIDQANFNRIVSFETGFKNAKGEIFCLLDSDDEYEPNYLEEVDKMFKKYPKYKMFHFGCSFKSRDGEDRGTREPHIFKKRKVGFEVFGGGNMVNGTFVWHRSIYDELGGYPPLETHNIDCSEIGYGEGPRSLFMTSPYDFSAYAQMEFPEIRPYFQEKHPDHPRGLVKELGNPFGQDFYLFYKYTRKYWSKPIKNKYLYKVNLK